MKTILTSKLKAVLDPETIDFASTNILALWALVFTTFGFRTRDWQLVTLFGFPGAWLIFRIVYAQFAEITKASIARVALYVVTAFVFVFTLAGCSDDAPQRSMSGGGGWYVSGVNV